MTASKNQTPFGNLLRNLVQVPKEEVVVLEEAELKENRRKRAEKARKKSKRPQR